METNKSKPKIKQIDPIDNLEKVKMYNETHTDSFMSVESMSMTELKRRYPLTPYETFETNGTKN